MKKTASQIADDVLEKLSYEPDAPPGLPALLAGGLGVGALGGALGGGAQSAGDILRAIQLKGIVPQQQAQRKALLSVLESARTQSPEVLGGLSDRALVKRLLGMGQSRGIDYQLRRGYEEGLAGLSRSTKTLKALQSKTLRNILRKSAIGAGVGLGGGLLGAAALGHFD